MHRPVLATAEAVVLERGSPSRWPHASIPRMRDATAEDVSLERGARFWWRRNANRCARTRHRLASSERGARIESFVGRKRRERNAPNGEPRERNAEVGSDRARGTMQANEIRFVER